MRFNNSSVVRFTGNLVLKEDEKETRKELIESLNDVPENYILMTINKNFSYGNYQCIAENILGRAVKNITIKEGFIPTAVTNVSHTSVKFHIPHGVVSYFGC